MPVPNLPGVPVLATYADPPDLAFALLTEDGSGIFNLSQPIQWGIFLNGESAIQADAVATFSFKQEWAISDYPLEQGAFASYDKVQIPQEIRFRFTSGGSQSNRQALINSIQAIAGDTTNFYTAVTPEQTIDNVTVTHWDYARNNAVGLLSIDVWAINVQVPTMTPDFQNTQSASGADQQSGGTVQPSDTPTVETSQPLTTSLSFSSDQP
jgi:hypothetical protein